VSWNKQTETPSEPAARLPEQLERNDLTGLAVTLPGLFFVPARSAGYAHFSGSSLDGFQF